MAVKILDLSRIRRAYCINQSRPDKKYDSVDTKRVKFAINAEKQSTCLIKSRHR